MKEGSNSYKKLEFNLLMINTFIYIGASVYSPFISSYYSLKEINPLKIGTLLAVGPVISILVQPLWAYISDRSGQRKNILSIVALGSSLSMLVYYIGNSFTLFFIATMFVTAFNTSLVPLSDAIIIDKAVSHNFDFAKIRLGGTLGYALVVFLAGGYLKTHPTALFIMSSLGYMVLVLFIRQLPMEKVNEKVIDDNADEEKLKIKSKGIFKSREIIYVLIFCFISQVGLSFCSGFLGVYILSMGYSQGIIGIMNCISALSEVPILLIINKLTKKYGAIKILAFSCIMMSIRIFLVTGSSIVAVILSQLLQSVTYMTVYYSCAVYISENVFKDKQSQGQSILAILQVGMGSIIGNVLGGYFVKTLGLKSAYMIMAAGVLGVSVITILLYKLFWYKKINNKRLCEE